MATFHSGSEGQTQKLQALRRRQKRLAFRAVIVPPVCWGICAASAPWWFPPLKEMLGVRFDAQTQGWILLVLMLLMISATLTGLVITSFEDALGVLPCLTAFIPMLMDTGGNSGSQACVTVIRGISLDEIEFRDIFKVVWKEIRVAVLCGICLAIACFGKIMLVDHMLLKSESVTTWVALVVSLSMAVTVFLAKLVGGTLPLLAKKLGFDPAVMASPIITTIVDFLSLLVYFTFATTILHIG